jgi:hypothetical protein
VQRGLVRPSFVLVVAAIGCSAPDRPPPAGDGTVADETRSAIGGSAECEPRTSRACQHYYRDERGQLQCPTSFQLCRADGHGWLPCAMYVIGPDGDPVPFEP